MGHFSSNEASLICFPEGRFENGGKVIKIFFYIYVTL